MKRTQDAGTGILAAHEGRPMLNFEKLKLASCGKGLEIPVVEAGFQRPLRWKTHEGGKQRKHGRQSWMRVCVVRSSIPRILLAVRG